MAADAVAEAAPPAVACQSPAASPGTALPTAAPPLPKNGPSLLQFSLHTSPTISQHTSPAAQLSALEQAKCAPVQGCVGAWHAPTSPPPLEDEELEPGCAHIDSETPSTTSVPVHWRPSRQSVFLPPGSTKQTCDEPGQLFAHTVPMTAVAVPGQKQADASLIAPPPGKQQAWPALQTLPCPQPTSPAQKSGSRNEAPTGPPELPELPPWVSVAGVQPFAVTAPAPESEGVSGAALASSPVS
jgi:hypothetical protein